ncbi:MAG: hypothetical protein IPF98_18845 [Gemmatimonadetes bacterium]|nr:hypothetical protein [Gemmatimonadota bacterium]
MARRPTLRAGRVVPRRGRWPRRAPAARLGARPGLSRRIGHRALPHSAQQPAHPRRVRASHQSGPRDFHKQVAIHDFYFGAPGVDPSIGKLGCIQQITAPGPDFVRRILPAPIGHIAAIGVPHVLALLSIAEDQPVASNFVSIDQANRDELGLPTLRIRHRYTRRDVAAGRALVQQSRRILREAGALFSMMHDLRSFSHAVGTVRMGQDEATSPLDDRGRFRGLDNLYVADGSALPTSGG